MEILWPHTDLSCIEKSLNDVQGARLGARWKLKHQQYTPMRLAAASNKEIVNFFNEKINAESAKRS